MTNLPPPPPPLPLIVMSFGCDKLQLMCTISSFDITGCHHMAHTGKQGGLDIITKPLVTT